METLKHFAEELKQQRELLGITLTDIFDKTRIDKKYLEAMENGDFEIMPQVYMRAFIRKYAEAVNLDANEFMLKYDAARSGKTYEEVSKTYETESSKAHEEEEIPTEQATKVGTNNKYFIFGSVLIIILVGIVYLIYTNSGSDKIIVEKPVEDIINERAENDTERFEIKTSKEISTPKTENITTTGDSLALKIYATDTVWVQLLVDNNKTSEYILYPTRSKILKAGTQINVLVGNSGGVQFTLNGKNIEFNGKKGEIKRIIFDQNGYHYSKKNLSVNE